MFRNLRISILALIALPSVIAGQGQLVPGLGVPGVEQVQGMASIEGYVIGTGGQPLNRAEVTLEPAAGRGREYAAVTTRDGKFLLANIEPGDYRLGVERDGYVDHEYGQVTPSRPGTTLVIAADQNVRDVVISMVPTATITGRVYDEEGEPIVGATVRALQYAYDDGQRVMRPVQSAETNDLGEYRLYWLDPGEYQVAATFEDRFDNAEDLRDAVLNASPELTAAIEDLRDQAAGGRGEITIAIQGRGGRGALLAGEIGDQLRDMIGVSADPLEEIYVDTYYPGTNDPRGAAPIRLQAAAEIRGVDFTVLPTRAATVRGQVVGPFSPEEGMRPSVTIVPKNPVVAIGRGGFGRIQTGGSGTSRDGSFELRGVPPGEYTIVATVREGRGRGGRGGGDALTGFSDVRVSGVDVDNIRLAVQPSVQIAGRILVDDPEINVSRLRVRLEPLDSIPLDQPNARVADDGTFVLDGVSPIPYRVSVTGLGEDAYVQSARIGGADVLSTGFVPSAGTGPLEFSISGQGSAVDGTIALDSDQAFTGAGVVLVPEDPARLDLYETSGTDQYGRFSMRGVAPGRYRVFAWEDAPAGAYQDPDFVRKYADYGESIEVRQGTPLTLEPRLIPAGI